MLASTLLFQKGRSKQADEVILFNQQQHITEGCSTNLFIVKQDVLVTPPLDRQILPGVTRHILLDVVNRHSTHSIEERAISMEEALGADEVLLSSSTKSVGAIVEIDGRAIGAGKPGSFWHFVGKLYEQHKLDY